jgi:hypothetical protein
MTPGSRGCRSIVSEGTLARYASDCDQARAWDANPSIGRSAEDVFCEARGRLK